MVKGVELHQIVSFFYCLTRSLMDHLDFKIPRLWEYERHSPIELQRIESIAEFCIPQSAKEIIKALETCDRGSFLERYIHCFFNCIGMQNIVIDGQPLPLEGIVKRHLLDSVFWEQIASSKTFR